MAGMTKSIDLLHSPGSYLSNSYLSSTRDFLPTTGVLQVVLVPSSVRRRYEYHSTRRVATNVVECQEVGL